MTAHTAPQIWFTGAHRKPPSVGLWRRLWRAFGQSGRGIGAHVLSVRLGAGQQLSLRNAAGWTAVCRTGVVWITQEADARDIFLNANESYALDRPGLAVLSAWRRDATVAIRSPIGGGGAARELREIEIYLPTSGKNAGLSWLRAAYPESGPWNDPASYRESGLL